MALEKIASIPEDLLDREAEEGKVAVKGKTEMGEGRTGMNTGKARRDEGKLLYCWLDYLADYVDSLNVVEMSQSPNLDVTPSSSAEPPVSPLSPELPVTDPQLHPDKPILSPDFTQYPLVIYSLLRTRLYRLTVYHLLQTPEYAVDQALLDRVAEYLKRGGAGKLASRLEKGWDGTLLPRDSSDAGASEEDRPPTHPIPSESSLRHAPNAWLIPRRAAARPLPPPSSSTLSSLTANYNSHLTRALLSPKKRSSSSTQSDNPLSPLNNLLTTIQPLQRPSGGMRQLRQLLRKIERLEAHRSFRPDWVTANLVVKCWMSCLMAGGQGWRAGSKRKGGEGEEAEIDKRMELRGLFAFVKVLFERRLEEQLALGPTSEGTSDPAIAEEGTSPATAPPSTTATTPALPGPASYPYRHTLSYTKHVRPFANDLLRALRQIGDRDGYHQVIGWQREMRERMEPVYAEWKAGSRSHKGRNGPS